MYPEGRNLLSLRVSRSNQAQYGERARRRRPTKPTESSSREFTRNASAGSKQLKLCLSCFDPGWLFPATPAGLIEPLDPLTDTDAQLCGAPRAGPAPLPRRTSSRALTHKHWPPAREPSPEPTQPTARLGHHPPAPTARPVAVAVGASQRQTVAEARAGSPGPWGR